MHVYVSQSDFCRSPLKLEPFYWHHPGQSHTHTHTGAVVNHQQDNSGHSDSCKRGDDLPRSILAHYGVVLKPFSCQCVCAPLYVRVCECEHPFNCKA